MTAAAAPSANLHLAGKYLNSLSQGDPSQRFFSGEEKFQSTPWSRFKMFLSLDWYVNELSSFYPHQLAIQRTKKMYDEERHSATQNAIFVTAASWFSIFNLARRGYVTPIFRQYGHFFKTHRLFRQYLYALVLPYAVFTDCVNYSWLNHTEAFWAVHSRRMNAKYLCDNLESLLILSTLCIQRRC